MKKICLLLCVMLLCGCQDIDNNKISNEESVLKYKEMEDKLIEYGKLVYENEQWLNNEAVEITTVMTLKDLSIRNGYDISMFVNPETNEQCDLENTRIEFVISDVSNLQDIKYEFNPVLVCGDYNTELESEDTVNEKYDDLYSRLADYMHDVYDIDTLDNKNLDVATYKITLDDFQKKGYDISMFKNPVTGKLCDLDKSYSLLKVDNINGKKDYKFNYYLYCE